MPLHIEDEHTEKEREVHPAGLRPATCLFVEDVGLQKVEYNGAEKIQRKGLFLWETSARKKDGSPFLILLNRTLSTFKEAKLRKEIQGLIGKDLTDEEAKKFDWDISGTSGLLNFSHKTEAGKTYANVSSMAPLMEGMAAYIPVTSSQPDWFKKIVSEAKAKSLTQAEAVNTVLNENVPPHSEDDLPF